MYCLAPIGSHTLDSPCVCCHTDPTHEMSAAKQAEIDAQTEQLLSLRDGGADTLSILKAAQKLLQLKQALSKILGGSTNAEEDRVQKFTARLEDLEKKMGDEESRIGSLENVVGTAPTSIAPPENIAPPASMWMLSMLNLLFTGFMFVQNLTPKRKEKNKKQ